MHTSTFGLKFGSLSPAVTLKIRSMSPKPNQLFIMSQCYIHANLVTIRQPVHEISCKQESVTPTLKCQRQQDPHQKQYVPLPFGGGHNHYRYNTVQTFSVMFTVTITWSYVIFTEVAEMFCLFLSSSQCLGRALTHYLRRFLGISQPQPNFS